MSIIPRGRALGVTLSTPQQDRYGYDAAYLRGRIVGALGGMMAEELVFGVTSTGAESDLQTCTAIARSMVGRWGMSERVGPVSIFPPEGDPRMFGVSEGTLDVVAEEVTEDYIVPSPFDPRVAPAVAAAVAAAARRDGVARLH